MGKNRDGSFIDDMVDEFGYDYVIGFCLCSAYDITNKANNEKDKDRANKLMSAARKYKAKAEKLTRERIENGL